MLSTRCVWVPPCELLVLSPPERQRSGRQDHRGGHREKGGQGWPPDPVSWGRWAGQAWSHPVSQGGLDPRGLGAHSGPMDSAEAASAPCGQPGSGVRGPPGSAPGASLSRAAQVSRADRRQTLSVRLPLVCCPGSAPGDRLALLPLWPHLQAALPVRPALPPPCSLYPALFFGAWLSLTCNITRLVYLLPPQARASPLAPRPSRPGVLAARPPVLLGPRTVPSTRRARGKSLRGEWVIQERCAPRGVFVGLRCDGGSSGHWVVFPGHWGTLRGTLLSTWVELRRWKGLRTTLLLD